MRTVVWFRGKDLRLADHGPLREALGGEVIPLFVLDPYFFAPERVGRWPHRAQFLLDSLEVLAREIAARGSRLVVVAGRSVEVVPSLVTAWGADRVVAQRWVDPVGRARDERIRAALGERFELLHGETIAAPGTLRTGGGGPYSVFTPFAKAWRRAAVVGSPIPAPRRLPPVPADVRAEEVPVPTCEALGLTRNPAVQQGGEPAARARLERFLDDAAARYAEDRDRMDLPGTSRLSADLKFGTLSAREAWTRARSVVGDGSSFHNELLWREFAHSTLQDAPGLLERPMNAKYQGFPWRDDEDAWRAWVEGRTGYPVVDAAARQLLAEGFVHNRARMVAASFLTRHLMIDFRRGEAHYLRWLTDGDPAQNDLGWQWAAGCGCDAQPWFRIFNPVRQGERFDPTGAYVRRWVPELARLPNRWLHAPWTAPPLELVAAGVRLGVDYPAPIVDHREARERYLTLAKAHLG